MNRFEKLVDLARAIQPEVMVNNFHVSFVLYKGRIVSVGLNSKKTHPLNLKYPKISREGVNVSPHKFTCSELNAFVKLKNLTNVPFSKCSVVNVRILKNGDLGYSAPCQSCKSLISYLDIKELYYTDFTGKFVKYSR